MLALRWSRKLWSARHSGGSPHSGPVLYIAREMLLEQERAFSSTPAPETAKAPPLAGQPFVNWWRRRAVLAPPCAARHSSIPGPRNPTRYAGPHPV